MVLILGAAPAPAGQEVLLAAASKAKKKKAQKKPPQGASGKGAKDSAQPQEEPRIFGEDEPEPGAGSGAPGDAPLAPSRTGVKAPPASPAAPEKGGTMVVFALPQEPQHAAAAGQLESELRRALAGYPDVVQVDLASTFRPSVPASLQEGDRLFDLGREQYDGLDSVSAAASFRQAAAFYEQYPVETRPERLARTWLYLGACLKLNRDEAGAREAFRKAAEAEPTLKPDPLIFAQDVQELFAAERDELERAGQGRLSVQSVPGGAEVKVRGKVLGYTPLEVELPAGTHPVVLSLPGYAPAGVYQELSRLKPAALNAKLVPLPGMDVVLEAAAKVAFTEQEDPLPTEVGAVASRLGARYVALVAVGPKWPRLQAWDVQTRKRLRGVEIEPGEAQSLRFAAAQLRAFATGQPMPTPPLSIPALARKPWFWAAVGGVAAAATAGVLIATQPPQRRNPIGDIIGVPGMGL